MLFNHTPLAQCGYAIMKQLSNASAASAPPTRGCPATASPSNKGELIYG
jgi:hypothetical protein